MTPKERIQALRREIQNNPGSRQFYQLGELLRREGELTEAVEVLRGGLAHHPRYVAAWVSLGRALLDLQELSQGRQAFRQALDLDPTNPVAWRLLGEALLGLGLRSEALEAFEHALALVPGDEVLASAVESLKGEAPDVSQASPAEAPKTSASEVFPLVDKEAGPAVPPEVTSEAFLEAQAESSSAPAFLAAPEPAFPDSGGGEEFPEPFFPCAPPPPPADVLPWEDVFAPSKATTAAPQTFGVEGEILLGSATFAEAAQLTPPEVTTEAVIPVPVSSAESAPVSGLAGEEPEASFWEPPPAGKATLAEAREAINRGEPEKALAILETLVQAEPENQEAVDLLALVRDMLEPLPPAEPKLSLRARKIAALQRFLAQVTLARERLGL